MQADFDERVAGRSSSWCRALLEQVFAGGVTAANANLAVPLEPGHVVEGEAPGGDCRVGGGEGCETAGCQPLASWLVAAARVRGFSSAGEQLVAQDA